MISRLVWDAAEISVTGGFWFCLRRWWIGSCRWRPAVRGSAYQTSIVVCRGVLRDPFRDSHIVVARFERQPSDDQFSSAWARAEEFAIDLNVRRA